MLTIVTPTYEKHAVQFQHMVESLRAFCQDLDQVSLTVVIERKNHALFEGIFRRFEGLRHKFIFTEDVLARFGVASDPATFLRDVDKFTFQSLKKLGGLLEAETEWSLVLDSEGLFHKAFRIETLLQDYAARKYVFYTRTKPRGERWLHSLGHSVTQNCARVLSVSAGDRWYMEYFHWFYETEKIRDLVDHHLGSVFYEAIKSQADHHLHLFENILYYLYLENFHNREYSFIDLQAELQELVPTSIARRFKLPELPFALFGNEYLLNIVTPDEVRELRPLFDRYKLPFVRLEPPFFSTRYVPELMALPSFVATISSHHMLWLKKKIAVCISGEFRHTHHRNPEHNLRHLLGFLSGVECDVYLHGWSNTSEAIILNELKPRAHCFEEKPSFEAMVRRIKYVEMNIKPGRDAGSLAMFYGIQQCFDLVKQSGEDYDYVLRIRPDIVSDLSLKEILIKISDEGDLLEDAIYVPQSFHSKGINDQFALGPLPLMETYSTTFSYLQNNLDKHFFNPETMLLRRLLESGVGIALLPMPYALMRDLPVRIDVVRDQLHHQYHVWWSRTDRLPVLQDVTAFFTDKLKAVEATMRGVLPDLLYLPVPDASAVGNGQAQGIVRARVFDHDPSRLAIAFFARKKGLRVGKFVLGDDGIEPRTDDDQTFRFVFPKGEEVILSEWRLERNKLVNHVLRVPEAQVATNEKEERAPMRKAWLRYRLERWWRVLRSWSREMRDHTRHRLREL